MELKLENGQHVFVELTNQKHGGEGWDFGECLWSPVYSFANGSESKKKNWKIMEDVKPGDLIIHSLKTSQGHKFTGVSIARNSYKIIKEEPVLPGKWKGHSVYYRIQLQNYSPFIQQIPIKDFLNDYANELKDTKISKSFFTINLGCAQKYLASVDEVIYKILTKFFDQRGITFFNNIEISEDEDIIFNEDGSKNGNENPEKVRLTICRTIRDTKMIKKLKIKYSNRCQICGKKIILPNGKEYSEGHHLKKLGGSHKGPDTEDNVIILCPFHHAEFDYGAIGIDPKSKRIIHIDPKDLFNNRALAYERKNLSTEYLKYHFKKIYNNV